jgi:hypothetical protein
VAALSLLDHPDAPALLADATLTPPTGPGCQHRLARLLPRSLPGLSRSEPRTHATLISPGRLRGLPRTTGTPTAREAGRPRTPLPFFVGSGTGNEEAVLAARRHLREPWADPPAVWGRDGRACPTTGTESGGGARPGGGRLGTPATCQLGVVLASAAPRGSAPRERPLSLPREGADDPGRRQKGPVPAEVEFREAGRSAAVGERRGPEWPPAGGSARTSAAVPPRSGRWGGSGACGTGSTGRAPHRPRPGAAPPPASPRRPGPQP